MPPGEMPGSISPTCDRDLAAGLRARDAGVRPGYHLSKRHGHTVTLDGPVPGQDVRELIDHSCHLVTARLTTAQRDQLIT